MKPLALVLALVLLIACLPTPAPPPANESSQGSPPPSPTPATVLEPRYDPKAARESTVEAVAACGEDDLDTCRDLLARAVELRPGQVEMWMMLAGLEHLRGNLDATRWALERIAAIGLRPPFERSPLVASLENADFFARTEAALEERARPIEVSEALFRLEDRDLVPEGVAFDPLTGDYFVSSVHRGAIVRVRATGGEWVESRFVEDGGLWSVLGLAIDAERRLLWATTSALPQMRGASGELEGRSALVALELETGEERSRVELRPDQPHNLNDLSIDSRGAVWSSDNRIPGALYRLDPGADELIAVHPEGFFRSPQGLAFSADEKRLYVADYSLGLTLLDLDDEGEVTQATYLPPPPDVCLTGLDGLAKAPADLPGRDVLVAIQNLYTPHRVLRLEVDPEGKKVTRVQVLEQNRPDYLEPTLGTIVGHDFVYVANSQWNRFGDDFGLPPAEELERPLLLRLPLTADQP